MVTVKENGNLLEVRFPYNPNTVTKVKTVTGRRWNPEQKCWTIPKENLPALLKTFPDAKFDNGMEKEINLMKKVITKELPDSTL